MAKFNHLIPQIIKIGVGQSSRITKLIKKAFIPTCSVFLPKAASGVKYILRYFGWILTKFVPNIIQCHTQSKLNLQ